EQGPVVADERDIRRPPNAHDTRNRSLAADAVEERREDVRVRETINGLAERAGECRPHRDHDFVTLLAAQRRPGLAHRGLPGGPTAEEARVDRVRQAPEPLPA